MILLKVIIILVTSIIFYFSILFNSLTSPLSIGVTIVVIALLVRIFLSFIINRTWLSFLLIIVFLTAIIVIFIYVSSLASNEITTVTPQITLVPAVLITIIIYNSNYYLNSIKINILTESFSFMHKIYINNIYLLSIYIIIYLFFVLIVTIKVASLEHFPLRKK
jgi:NADH-ubiquinone oxidoreductase chain 6